MLYFCISIVSFDFSFSIFSRGGEEGGGRGRSGGVVCVGGGGEGKGGEGGRRGGGTPLQEPLKKGRAAERIRRIRDSTSTGDWANGKRGEQESGRSRERENRPRSRSTVHCTLG